MDQIQFQTLFPNAANGIFDAISCMTAQYGITNLVMFLSQTSYESGQFTQYIENLNYSATRLVQVWPNYFPTVAKAKPYANNPQKLANLVYANRLGNGNTASGDGWEFKGRGLIQLTGRTRYQDFATYISTNIDDVPPYMETPTGAVESACWYWTQFANIDNKYSNRTDVPTVTQLVNGGESGLDQRYAEFDRINAILTAN